MIDRELHQLVLPPGTDETIIDHVVAMVEPLQSDIGWRLKARIILARLLHPLGMHYWVTWNGYDPNGDRITELGLVCKWCPQAQT